MSNWFNHRTGCESARRHRARGFAGRGSGLQSERTKLQSAVEVEARRVDEHRFVGMNIGMKAARRAPLGGTKKVTISLRPADLDVMTRFANRRHGGNLSGAFADLIAHATRLEAMDRVLAELPPASPEGLARLEEEIARPPTLQRGKRRAKRKTAA